MYINKLLKVIKRKIIIQVRPNKINKVLIEVLMFILTPDFPFNRRFPSVKWEIGYNIERMRKRFRSLRYLEPLDVCHEKNNIECCLH